MGVRGPYVSSRPWLGYHVDNFNRQSKMATAILKEDDDFVTCGVCLWGYDAVVRKPKFLQCSHSICVVCLQAIWVNGTIICPFCRNCFSVESITSVPNNTYALRMLKLKDTLKEGSSIAANPLVVNWCITCASAQKPTCAPSGHSSVNMSADVIKHMDSLLNLKEEMTKTKEQAINNLSLAIEKHQAVQEQLTLVSKSINAVADQVKKLQDTNNLQLTKMISIVEGDRNRLSMKAKVLKSSNENEDLFLQELMDLVDDSSPQDTPEVLKIKMDKFLEDSQSKLGIATSIVKDYQLQKKIKIVVKLFSENDQPIPTCPLLEAGFRLQQTGSSSESPRNWQSLVLASYGIFSFLDAKKVKMQSIKPPKQNKASKPKPLSASIFKPINKIFIPSQSVFIVRLFKSGNPAGEVHIRPEANIFHSELLLKLGQWCYHCPMEFGNAIEKCVSGVFVLFKMAHVSFQPTFSNVNLPKKGHSIGDVNNAGVVKIEVIPGANNILSSWRFLFPLEGFKDPKQKKPVSSLPATTLFGRVVSPEMLKLISLLSSINKTDRTSYTLTLESK